MPKIVNLKKNLRPYNIALSEDNEATIEMYGEVVESVPIDWWTGEQADGLYIVLQDFLKDLEEGDIKTADKVTVRINSPGGDLESGIVIYNRLRELNNVTTIIDGLAASAASIIAQAGSTRKVYASAQMMIHGASVLLYDYYNSQELDKIKDLLTAADNQVISVYKERTGLNETKLRHMVEKTTWMTGQEIIDNGFADEIIEGSVSMVASADHRFFMCNGVPMNAKRFKEIPTGTIEDENLNHADAKSDGNTNLAKEEKAMTLEEFKNQHPDLVKAIEDAALQSATNEAAEKAVNEERARIKDIESIENTIADKELVNKAKFEEPMDARELAFVAMQQQAKTDDALRNQFLENSAKDTVESGAEDVTTAPNDGYSANEDTVDDTEESVMNVLNTLNKLKKED